MGHDRRWWFVVASAALVALCPVAEMGAVTAEAGSVAPSISLSVSQARHGATVTVTLPGCVDDGLVPEANLMVIERGKPVSAAVVLSSVAPSTEVTLTVPAWAPSGPAWVGGTCVDEMTALGGDGAFNESFQYQPVAFTVLPGGGGPGASPLQVTYNSKSGMLHVAGSGCSGQVDLSVASGSDRVAAESRFRYAPSHMRLSSDPNGDWSVDG